MGLQSQRARPRLQPHRAAHRPGIPSARAPRVRLAPRPRAPSTKRMALADHHSRPATCSPCPVVGPPARSQQRRLHYFLRLLRLAQRAAPSASACQLVRKSASQPAMEICRRTAVREILDSQQRRAAACQPSGPGSGLWVRCGRALPGQFGSRVVSRIVFASQTQTTPTRRYLTAETPKCKSRVFEYGCY